MTVITTSLSIGQVVTVINVFIAIIQYTLPLLLVILLLYFMPKTNNALTWNSINQTLHSSLWPMLLRTDSSRSTGSGAVVGVVSLLFISSAILLPVSRIVLPLGLRDGPFIPSSPVQFEARYVPDTSPLRLATSAQRDSFRHGYQCTPNESGCDSNGITALIPPLMNDIFRSTPHNPFSIQYRQFFNKDAQAASTGYSGSAEIYITRNDTLVIEGLVIDMTSSHPGIGFINHTLPQVSGSELGELGGTWSQDVLFLEPITSCIDTNITAEFVFENGLSANGIGQLLPYREYNITDRGGFANLPEIPQDIFADYTREDFNLQKHAYNGAVLVTREIMSNLNATQDTTYVNKTYSVAYADDYGSDILPLYLGRSTPLPLEMIPTQDPSTLTQRRAYLRTACSGFTPQDPSNINTVHVTCGMFLGPPFRTDGGESNLYEPGSRWMQTMHTCASATRASIQTVTFSLPSFNNSVIAKLKATRDLDRPTVLWAMEERSTRIMESIPLWGRIDEQYLENDLSSLWTSRSDHFLLPATAGSLNPDNLPDGSPQNAHANIWGWVNRRVPLVASASSITDYSGRTDFAMRTKFRDLVNQNGPTAGAQTALNLMWTDMMANRLVGTTKTEALDVTLNMHTLDYDFRLAIPGYILALIWLPVFLLAIFLLVLKQLKWTYFKAVYDQLSIGRVLTNSSALRVISEESESTHMPEREKQPGAETVEHGCWRRDAGQTQIALVSRRKGQRAETMKLMGSDGLQ